jgi:hypothetical protein
MQLTNIPLHRFNDNDDHNNNNSGPSVFVAVITSHFLLID